MTQNKKVVEPQLKPFIVEVPIFNEKDTPCQIVDEPDLFFPDPSDKKAIKEAKILCAQCHVQDECFNFAMKNDIRHGVWGGYTERERAKIRKVQRYTKKYENGGTHG